MQHSTFRKPQQPTPLVHPKLNEQTGTPRGYCFKFHKGVECAAGCAFKHLCYKCEGPHPVSRCNFRASSKPSFRQPRPSPPNLTLPTSVRIDRLDFLLSGYNHSIAEFISSGFREGFPLHYEGVRESSDAKNLISAWDNPEVVDTKITKELEAGRLAGPFQVRPFHRFGFLH